MDLTEAWSAILPRMRWFAGKGRQIIEVQVSPGPWVSEPPHWPAVRTETITVRYADAQPEHYLALSAYRLAEQVSAGAGTPVELDDLGPVSLSDATTDAEAFDRFVQSLPLAQAGVELGPARPLGGEQSNTSVRIGDHALFKLYRRPPLLPAREEELLSRLQNSRVTPRLYQAGHSPALTPGAPGRLSYLVTEYVAATGDGWALAGRAIAAAVDVTADVAALGAALRELHNDLLHPTRPYPAQICGRAEVPATAIGAAMATRLAQAVGEVPLLARWELPARAVYAAVDAGSVCVQQIHGDFHLGQCLRRADGSGWVIIDFEGEPMADRDQQFAPDSRWRDVAGALRSLDYVRSQHPDPDSSAAKQWVRTHRRAFLDGYAAAEPVPTAVLRAYELDKAVYEVRYEARNRPDWVPIPLGWVQDELSPITASISQHQEEQP